MTPSTTIRSPAAQLVPLPPAEDFHEPSLANVTVMSCFPWVMAAAVCQTSPFQVPVSHAG